LKELRLAQNPHFNQIVVILMASEAFVLLPCAPEDVEAMISVYERAFANDYFSSFTFPRHSITEAEKHRWLRARFLGTFSKPELRNFKIVEARTGRMAAWARWGFPYVFSEEELGEREAEKDSWPEGSYLEVCEVKFGGLHKKRDAYARKDETYSESRN
jgi:hypothetical protein